MASKPRTSSISSSQGRASDGDRKEPRKSAITRVRTGCFTCRKRKKKCDGMFRIHLEMRLWSFLTNLYLDDAEPITLTSLPRTKASVRKLSEDWRGM
jgi:hypothetical protein